MSSSTEQTAIKVQTFDWDEIKLVVFDVDGTLYRQAPLRVRMAAKLLWHSLARLDVKTPASLRYYRKLREELAELEVADFEIYLRARTSDRFGIPADAVDDIVAKWIEQEPLLYLRSCAYSGLQQLFAGIRQSGRTIGILSDYGASAKLSALGLTADRIVIASDVGMLKPHPRGLETLIASESVTPAQTLVIGDRVERDGAAARRAGAKALILSSQPIDGWMTFRAYEDPIFDVFTRPPRRVDGRERDVPPAGD
jgi:FMN phosphatase YigB (HAD superfamily)